MSSALYVPLFRGELGWELINYVPHINYVCSRKKYDEIHIVVREGREGIYPMGTNFYSVSVTSHKSMGNSGSKGPKNSILHDLSSRLSTDHVNEPREGMAFIKHRNFLKYEASKELLKKWNQIPSNAVILCVRGRKFGNHKNWSASKWMGLCRFLLQLKLVPVITGIQETVIFEPPSGCINLWDKTTLKDLIAVMQKSLFVVGQSTGPLHLASLSGVPHAVWGSNRLKRRYLKQWNPHRAMVEYHACGNNFNISSADIQKLVNRLIKKGNICV